MNKIFKTILLAIILTFIGCCPIETENEETPEMHSIYLKNGKRLDYWTINIDNQIYKVFWLPDGRYTVIQEIKIENNIENNNNDNFFNF